MAIVRRSRLPGESDAVAVSLNFSFAPKARRLLRVARRRLLSRTRISFAGPAASCLLTGVSLIE